MTLMTSTKMQTLDMAYIGLFAVVIAICSWISIPTVVPFSGFKGGIGVLLNTTGGYIIGFVFSALVMWAFEKSFGKKTWALILSMVLALAVCYAFGTVWFMIVYAKNVGAVGLSAVLGWCVIPFIIPDLAKITLAFILSNRISKAVTLS